MERLEFKFNRVLAMYQRLGERLEELAKEIADRKVAAMAEKAEEERMERRRMQQQQQQPQMVAITESWDDDDHPPFCLGSDSRRKRNPANYCPACRGPCNFVKPKQGQM